MFHKHQVHLLVIVGIHRSGGSEEGDGTALVIKHRGLTDILLLTIEGHDVARGGEPQRQSQRGRLSEVRCLQHQFVRDGVGSAVSGIVHHQGAISHLLFDQSRHIRETVTRRRGGTLVGIPVDLLHIITGIGILHEGSHTIGSRHVRVVVAVVTHHTDGILPRTRQFIIGIADGLVHKHLGLFETAGRETSHRHIGLTQIGFGTRALFYLFPIVEQGVEVVTHITIHMTERVLALETQQEIIGITTAPIRCQHAVVVGTVAKEQQVSGHLGIRLRTVVEHLHIASVGRGIRRAAAELMIELVGRDDTHRKTVALFV